MKIIAKTNFLFLGMWALLLAWGFACATNHSAQEIKKEPAQNQADEDMSLDGTGGDDSPEATLANEDAVDFAEDGEVSQEFTADDSKAETSDLFGDEQNAEGHAPVATPSDAITDPSAAASNPMGLATAITEDVSEAPAAEAQLEEGPAPEVVNTVVAEAEAAASDDPSKATIIPEIDPVGIDSTMTPPSLEEMAPAAPVPPATSVQTSEEEEETKTDVSDVSAQLASLEWVGYRINEKARELKIELTTRGKPDFEIIEERNRAQQSELVIRFFQTKLRKKIRWSIDSSEFRSPVAFIRMREFRDRGIVDVVMTQRDALAPQFFARDGQMLLVYPIPARYFDAAKPLAKKMKDRGISLVKDELAPLKSTLISASKDVGYHRPDLFKETPKQLRPIREIIHEQSREAVDSKGLPPSFDRRALRSSREQAQRSGWRMQRFSLMAVAQDDLENEETETNTEENTSSEEGNASAEGNNAKETPANSNAIAIPAEDVPTEGNTQGLENESPGLENAGAGNANAIPQNETPSPGLDADPEPNEQAVGGNSEADPLSGQATDLNADRAIAAPAPTELTGQESAEATGQQYNGKPIFMEFYEAPLSLVLKSFSEETGNNFVFPAAVGQTPVTVHFKGVPWDEALKAILETHSLGLVRIGQNVVRVDQVVNLSSYMQALETAKQFETRRLPTKVLIFRLNNAVAKDISARITLLLARDVELDARIKISEDERTNSIVMEAPSHVLAKAKNIIERLDLETPQVEIASRIVEVSKNSNNFFGVSWLNNFNFDPGRALGFGSLNFPNSLGSTFAVDPGVNTAQTAGVGRFRLGSLNKFVDLDLLLKLEEKKGTTEVLQSNRVLVLDGEPAKILAGNSKFFRPAAGAVASPTPGATGASEGLSEVKFNLSLEVTPQVTALGSVIMKLHIISDTPGDPTGQALADKNTRELETQMVRSNGDTGVIGGIYDTNRTTSITGIPFLADIPIIGALFRSTSTVENQTELLIMVTPTIVSGQSKEAELADEAAADAKNPRRWQASEKIKASKVDKSIF